MGIPPPHPTPSKPHAFALNVGAEYGPRLTRYAASILRDADRAEDAVQDVLCKLIEGVVSTPDDPSALRAWLFTAVRNRCIDLLRKEGRMTTIAELEGIATTTTTTTANSPAKYDPAVIAGIADEAQAALAALDELPTLQRDALRLRFSGGLSYKQIAEAMDKSVSHVGVLIHEGLATLRTRLDSRPN